MLNITAKDIMSKKVHTVRPKTTVKELAKFLLKHKISGAPVVDERGAVVGVVTEEDLIFRDASVHLPTVVTLFDAVFYLESSKKIEQELLKIVGQRVADIMTKKVILITPATPIQEMATLMHEKHCHVLPVVEAGKLKGIVGKADLVRAIALEEA
jgi:CBS-domain-containing membrane protein